ncbi:MAG TPA: YajQ family cyclic di-GMP-binding protein [Turneriella sp.]|nr:YajQ family cyclic di-GMP-binding protein [Turneriella sp.]
MAQDSSFDIVSETNWQELTNAIDQAQREIANRFDFKGTQVAITLEDKEMVLIADDEGKLNQLKDVVESKLIKRGIALKSVDYQKMESAFGGNVRQKATFVNGIAQEHAKKINVLIRDSKLKVRSQVEGDKVRVSGKSRDDLQAVMKLLNEAELPIPLQYTNYR